MDTAVTFLPATVIALLAVETLRHLLAALILAMGG